MFHMIFILLCLAISKECNPTIFDKFKNEIKQVSDSLQSGAKALEDAGKSGGSLDKAQASVEDMFTKIGDKQSTISAGLKKNQDSIPQLQKLRDDIQKNNKITDTLKKDLLAALDNLITALNKLNTIFTQLKQDIDTIIQYNKPCPFTVNAFNFADAQLKCPIEALKYHVRGTQQQAVAGGSGLNLPGRMRAVADTLLKLT